VPGVSRVTLNEIVALTETELPWAVEFGLAPEALDEGWARVRLRHADRNLRPGGTVSGPAMMALADYSLFVAVLTAIGRQDLAVTSQLSINFLRRPAPRDLLAEARMIRVGRRLAYGEVLLFSEGAPSGDPVAHVTGSYALPATG
jgi:uncharacterized protein (TIGR00369 family)